MTKLDDTIRAIDDLIAALKSGTLGSRSGATTAPSKPAAQAPTQPAVPAATAAPAQPKPKKQEKEPKAAKPAKTKAPQGPVEGPDLFVKAELVIAQVLEAQNHPNSDKLYICKLDVGAGQTRQVVAGLQQYVPQAELQGSHVMVILNLKPAKLGGELSEAMILAASFVGEDGSKDTVKVLAAPKGSVAGDRVYLDGVHSGASPENYVKQMKGDHWRKIVSGLSVVGDDACFEGHKMVTDKGPITAPGMNGAEIH